MIAPLRYVISLKRRSKITIMAIAVVIMFITSTSIITYSFEISNKELVEKFESRYYMIYSNENILRSSVPISDNINGAYVYVIPSKIDNKSTYLVGIYDPHKVLSSFFQCNYGDIILGDDFKDYKIGNEINVVLNSSTISLHIANIHSLILFPSYWGVINYTLAQKYRKNPNFVIINKNEKIDGFHTSSMIGLSDFYFKSSEEITTDLLLLALISIVAVYFFINSLLTIEIRESVKKISIIRALGSTTKNIDAIYILRSLYIGVSGMLLGISAGIVIAYLVAAVFPFTGILTYFVIYIPLKVFAFPLIIILVGSVFGIIQPLLSANKVNIVKGMRGVMK